MPSASRLARWSLGSFGSFARLGGSFGGVCASVPLGPFLCRGAVPPFSCLSSGFALGALGAVCFCDRVRVSGALRPASEVVPCCPCPCRWFELGLGPSALVAFCFCERARASGVLRPAPAVVPGFPCAGVSSCGAALPSCPLLVSLSVSLPTSLLSSPFWGMDCAWVHTSFLMFRWLFSFFVCGFLVQCDYA